MYLAPGNSEDVLRWLENGYADYESACRRCCIDVLVPDESARSMIAEKLRYDKRPSGSRGRALTQDIPLFNLTRHDRLEPSTTLMDVGSFEAMPVPTTVVFWRPSFESLNLNYAVCRAWPRADQGAHH